MITNQFLETEILFILEKHKKYLILLCDTEQGISSGPVPVFNSYNEAFWCSF